MRREALNLVDTKFEIDFWEGRTDDDGWRFMLSEPLDFSRVTEEGLKDNPNAYLLSLLINP